MFARPIRQAYWRTAILVRTFKQTGAFWLEFEKGTYRELDISQLYLQFTIADCIIL